MISDSETYIHKDKEVSADLCDETLTVSMGVWLVVSGSPRLRGVTRPVRMSVTQISFRS